MVTWVRVDWVLLPPAQMPPPFPPVEAAFPLRTVICEKDYDIPSIRLNAKDRGRMVAIYDRPILTCANDVYVACDC